ncbi:hypothetical protein BC835DRAFT_1296636, partial [Cytidiella melzeri]
TDPIQSCDRPVLLADCEYLCSTCYSVTSKGSLPKNALANGLWYGAAQRMAGKINQV